MIELYERTPLKQDLDDGTPPIKVGMWFDVPYPIFAVAGFWQHMAMNDGFTMVTCDPNAVVAPTHPAAM